MESIYSHASALETKNGKGISSLYKSKGLSLLRRPSLLLLLQVDEIVIVSAKNGVLARGG